MVDEILFVNVNILVTMMITKKWFFFRLICINVLKVYVLCVWSSVLRLHLNKKKDIQINKTKLCFIKISTRKYSSLSSFGTKI